MNKEIAVASLRRDRSLFYCWKVRGVDVNAEQKTGVDAENAFGGDASKALKIGLRGENDDAETTM